MVVRAETILDPSQRRVLIVEASSTKNLLRDAIAAVRAMKYQTLGGDAVFALASHGVEKLLKLTIGIDRLRRGDSWPTVTEMRQEHGHHLVEMAEVVDQILVAAADRPYLSGLLDARRHDPLWGKVIGALDRYATAGRFHGLDNLAGKNLEEDLNPHAMWQMLEVDAMSLVPSLVDFSAYGDNDRVDEAVAQVRNHVATSVERWWATIAQFHIIGALGDAGRLVGFECAPDDWSRILKGHLSWHQAMR